MYSLDSGRREGIFLGTRMVEEVFPEPWRRVGLFCVTLHKESWYPCVRTEGVFPGPWMERGGVYNYFKTSYTTILSLQLY